MAADGWRSRYSGSWRGLRIVGSFTIATPEGSIPIRIGTVGSLEIFQIAHALAIYDPSRNRHAWFLNLAVPSDSYKLDRWPVMQEVVAVSSTAIRVKLGYWEETQNRDLTVHFEPPPPQ